MTASHLLRDLIFWISAFSCGSALFTTALCLRMWKSNPRRYLAFAGFKVGYAGAVGIVLIRILLPITEVTPDPWAWSYFIAVAVAGVSALGVGRAVRLEYVEWEAAKKTPKEEES